MYNSGVKYDKLALLYNINTHVKIAVKTPVGKNKRKIIFNVITQGDVFGPILCSNKWTLLARNVRLKEIIFIHGNSTPWNSGRPEYKRQALMVDTWKEVEIKDDVTDEMEIKDIFAGEEVIEEIDEEKNLGDVISTDGRNLKNIKKRFDEGKGIVNRIFTLIENMPFRKHYFEVGILLRDCLLVTSMLYNST